MRSQQERDEQAVTIATSLAIVVGILVVGVLLGLLIDTFADLSNGAVSALGIGTSVVAGVAGLSYLVRHLRT